MAKKSKQPKVKEVPSTTKQPKIAVDPQDYYQKKPAWRVSRMEFSDPFGWHVLDTDGISFIWEKLANFETMTWGEILLVAKKHNHNVSVDKLVKEAQDRLVEVNLDDLDELTSLHLTGRGRVWGIIDRGVMDLLWWDADHRVCVSHKKTLSGLLFLRSRSG